jgi:hypothetical protein
MNSPPVPLDNQSLTNNDFLAPVTVKREVASLTSSENASNAIRQVGETIVKAAGSKLFDEYCGTPVKPHVPVPRPKGVAAA